MVLDFLISPATVPRETAVDLGGARLGALSVVDDGLPWQPLRAPLLAGGPRCEFWRVRAPAGQARGAVPGEGANGMRWRRVGDVLFGVIELDEGDFAGGPLPPLQAATAAAYRQLFALLERERLPHLWRLWNYMADINIESHGLERYRQFNVGRQQAFWSARRHTEGSVPAACALGTAEGPLSIAFLAGRVPARAIENPRQVSAYAYPAVYGPSSPTFSRAARVDLPEQAWLFVSGTASIVGHQTRHGGDPVAQCRETLTNIAAVVAEANGSGATFALSDLSYRVYLRQAGDLAEIMPVLQEVLPGADLMVVQADVCRSDLLLEIEAQGVRPTGGAS